MKAKKIVVLATTAVVAGVCGVTLAACSGGGSNASSVKTYTISFSSEAYNDWEADNDQPLSLGSGGCLWGLETWATGDKVTTDDDGNIIGGTYSYTLAIDENCSVYNYVAYTLTYSAHVPSSDTYKEPNDLVYSFQGYAYEIDGGYHLLAPNYAEGFMASGPLGNMGSVGVPAPEGSADMGAGYNETAGPNGGTIKYVYTNSELMLMGAMYGIPFMVQNNYSNILQGMFVCDVQVDGDSIVSFKNYDEIAILPNIPQSTGSIGGVGDIGGDTDTDEPAEDDSKVAYGFAPGWAASNPPISVEQDMTEDKTVNLSAFAKENGVYSAVDIKFSFAVAGRAVTVEITDGDKTVTLSGTYTPWYVQQQYEFVIQLGTTDGVTWATGDDATVKGATINGITYNWISKGGLIVLACEANSGTYAFNLDRNASSGGDEEMTPPSGDDVDTIIDDEVAYDWAPFWAKEGEDTTLTEDATVTIIAGAQGGIGWANATVTFTFKADDAQTVEISVVQGPNEATYTGTYQVWLDVQGHGQYIIQLDDNDDITFNTDDGTVTIGNLTVYWISQDGKIAVGVDINNGGYMFAEVSEMGGDFPGPSEGGDFGGPSEGGDFSGPSEDGDDTSDSEETETDDTND